MVEEMRNNNYRKSEGSIKEEQPITKDILSELKKKFKIMFTENSNKRESRLQR